MWGRARGPGEHEQAAEAVERPEQHEEVRCLHARDPLADATIVTSSGNQHSFNANRNCTISSPANG